MAKIVKIAYQVRFGSEDGQELLISQEGSGPSMSPKSFDEAVEVLASRVRAKLESLAGSSKSVQENQQLLAKLKDKDESIAKLKAEIEAHKELHEASKKRKESKGLLG